MCMVAYDNHLQGIPWEGLLSFSTMRIIIFPDQKCRVTLIGLQGREHTIMYNNNSPPNLVVSILSLLSSSGTIILGVFRAI